MILKGNQRGGAKDLALHLMKDENDHIEVYELRGFASQNLMGALNEAYAVSRGTRCKQFLYSLSLNPPQDVNVPTAGFMAAIERCEKRLGLSLQPRAIVFHEKSGRRHAHVVWSRIDIKAMKAVHFFRDHEKLMSVSRELFLEHGWTMPAGLAVSEARDPRNFTLAEWQQAKRTGGHPRETRTAIQDAWAISDSRTAFIHALEERGFRLARGDKRGFVAVDVHGEVYSIPKQAEVTTKQVRERLGDASALPPVSEVKQQIAADMLAKMDGFRRELGEQEQQLEADFQRRRGDLVRRQRAERRALRDKIENRANAESVERQSRFRSGLGGLWDRLRGQHKRIRGRNELEAEAAAVRDRAEWDALVFAQVRDRRTLNIFRLNVRRDHDHERREIEADIGSFNDVARKAAEEDRGRDPPKSRTPTQERPRRRRSRTRGPAPEP